MRGLTDRFRFLLFPLALFYWGLILWRDLFYKIGFFVTHRLPVPVVSVGNITMGGTGKTPTVISIAEILLSMGKKPAIVSRGYGRETTGTVIVSDGRETLATWQEAGDEPFLIATRLPGVPVVVDEVRFRGGMTALEQFKVDVLILDDAFQHRAVERDLDIVLINSREDPGHYRMFPYGRLREPTWSVSRGDMVVLTRADGDKAFPSVHRKVAPYTDTIIKNILRSRETVDLRGVKVAAFCGVGDPNSFSATLAELEVKIIEFQKFRDHHVYNETDMNRLRKLAKEGNVDTLVTTEKDWVKLSGLKRKEDSIVPVPVDVVWLNGGKTLLRDALKRLF